jgi:hypothetical protein
VSSVVSVAAVVAVVAVILAEVILSEDCCSAGSAWSADELESEFMISTPSTGATFVVVTFEGEVLLLVLFGGSEVVTFSDTVVGGSEVVAFSSAIVGSCGTVLL